MSGAYIASRTGHAHPWRQLRQEGWPICSTWIDEAGQGQTNDLGELWRRIGNEIDDSHGLILYIGEDDFPLKGALVEVGMAIGCGRTVVVVAPDVKLEANTYRPIGSWIMHPWVKKCGTIVEAFHALRLKRNQA